MQNPPKKQQKTMKKQGEGLLPLDTQSQVIQ